MRLDAGAGVSEDAAGGRARRVLHADMRMRSLSGHLGPPLAGGVSPGWGRCGPTDGAILTRRGEAIILAPAGQKATFRGHEVPLNGQERPSRRHLWPPKRQKTTEWDSNPSGFCGQCARRDRLGCGDEGAVGVGPGTLPGAARRPLDALVRVTLIWIDGWCCRRPSRGRRRRRRGARTRCRLDRFLRNA